MPNTAVSTMPATASPPSGPDAEVADDRGVGEQVERLGDERPERRDRQPHDVAVVLAAAGRQARIARTLPTLGRSGLRTSAAPAAPR